MCRILILLIITAYCISSAEEKIQYSKSYKSYSYTLMDELKLKISQSQANKALMKKPYQVIYNQKIKNTNKISDIINQSANYALNQVNNKENDFLQFSSAFNSSILDSSATLYINIYPNIKPYIGAQYIMPKDLKQGKILFNDINNLSNDVKRSTMFLIGTKIEF